MRIPYISGTTSHQSGSSFIEQINDPPKPRQSDKHRIRNSRGSDSISRVRAAQLFCLY
ncbi:hypothetical protein C8Q79DRAFT_126772 [Trametes meyenii]|nr:hypothetical protein C8Q79DRAFT_126772 [Trametes meyenii]